MTDSVKFEHLDNLLSPISEDSPCGNDLRGDEVYARIERAIENPQDTKEWKELKKDIHELLSKTKDIRLIAHFCRTLIHTEKRSIEGISQGLFLLNEYIKNYWECLYPPEYKDDPEERYFDRINAAAELGSWKTIILPLRKKIPILSFDSLGEYFLEDLVSFKKGDAVEGKQSLKELAPTLTEDENEKINTTLNSFKVALNLAEEIKQQLLERTAEGFTDFDSYLIPNLNDGISTLSELSSNSEDTLNTTIENNEKTSDSIPTPSKEIGLIQSRDDVIIILDKICDYYDQNEPSSPLPLLLKRAKGIVHKDFLEVLEELVPGGVSMTESVFGKTEENEN